MADNTASLVVALSAQLKKFENDMRDAGIMAERATKDIEGKFSKMNPQVSASFAGNLLASLAGQAVKGAIDAVKELADRFTDLQKTAGYAEVSMQWLYGVQEVGAKAGASIGDVNAAVKSLAFQLDEMKRGGDNALKTLLNANPTFLKGVRVDALDAAGALKIVAEIMANMSKLRAVDVGKNLGLPESTVEAWRQGGEALEAAISKAAAKAPDLERLAEQSRALKKVWDDFLSGMQTSFLDNFFGAFKTMVAGIIALLERFTNSQEGTTIMGRAADQALDAWREVGKEIDKVGDKPKRVIITGGTAGVDPFARKSRGSERESFLDRENRQTEEHIALLERETATVGNSLAVQVAAREEQKLLNAAKRDGTVITEELSEAIKAQAETLGKATAANVKAKEGIAAINAASQQVGSALSSAFADAIIEGKKLDEVLQSLVKSLLRMAINQTFSSIFSNFKIGAAAGGTDFAPGGLTLVGEKGPELVNLPRGSQVTPNDVLRQGSLGGTAINYAPMIDARGASVEAVARLAQIIEQDRAAFASKTVMTIQTARRNRIPGV